MDVKKILSKLNLNVFHLKGSASKGIVVVEIGNDWVKVIEATGSMINKAKTLKMVDIKGSVSDAIAKLFKDMRLSKNAVYVSLPRHLTTVRILEFPSTDEKEINEMVNLQIGKQTPYSRDEILSAHTIFPSGREGYSKAQIIIARKSLVSERIEVLQKSGINVEKVIVSTEGVFHWFCVAHLMQAGKEGETFVLVDVDSNYTDLIVLRKGKLVYSRNILLGSNNLIGQVGKWEEKFIEEVAHSIDLYNHEERYARIDKIFLSGAASHIKGLDQFLSTRLNLPVEMAHPSSGIKVRDGIDLLKDAGFKYVSMSQVMGISLRYDALVLDLTPPGLRIQKVMDEQRKQLTLMGILITSLLFLVSIFILQVIYSKNKYLSELKKTIVKVEKESQAIDNMRMSIDMIKERLDSKKRSINVFNEIHRLTPKDIYFTSISINERDETVLQGNAEKMSNVFEFVTILENSSYFENVKTTFTSTKKTRDGEYAKFEIVCSAELDKE